MRRPEIPITWRWGLDLRHMEGLLVGFAIIDIGSGGTAAVDGQLSVVEGDTVECGIGHGVVGLPFARTKGIGEALRGRGLIGGAVHGLCVADMEESIAVVRRNGYGLSMWLGVEARTVLEVNTRRTVFSLALVPLWLWLWLWL
jgi:hypothetical protein